MRLQLLADLLGTRRTSFHQTCARWYNLATYTVPCRVAVSSPGACLQQACQYGVGRGGILRGPQTANFDISATKSFVWENMKMLFHVDAFDSLNYPVLGIPTRTINSGKPASTSVAIADAEGEGQDLPSSLKSMF